MAFSTGIQDKKSISAVSLLDKPQLLRKAVDTNMEEGLIDIASIGGQYKEVKGPKFENWTEDALHILMDTTGATIVGSGSSATLTGVTLTPATSGYARVGLKVMMPNKKTAIITAKTTSGGQDTLTLKSTDGTNLTLVAGNKIAPMNVTVGERSSAPASLKHGWTKYFNLIELHRESYDLTDIQAGSEIEIEYEGQNYVFSRDRANAFMRFKAGINASLFAGTISATKFEDASPSLTDPGNGGAVQTGRGLNQYVETYGVNDAVDVPGTVDLDDMESYFNFMTAARAPKDYHVYSSNAVKMKFNNFYKGLNSSGVPAGRLSLDGKNFDWNAESFKYGFYNITHVHMGILDNPVLFSQTDIVKSAYFVPQGTVATKGGGRESYMSIRYMKTQQPGMGNEIWEEWETGALAKGGPTSEIRERRVNFFTAQALEILGAQHFGKLVVL